MKTVKKWIAVCLAVVMAFSAATVCASAQDVTEQPTSRFRVSGARLTVSRLTAIDLSDQIRDLSTINTGTLIIEDEEPCLWATAEFDPQQPGVVLLGGRNEEGDFYTSDIELTSINYTFTLSAAEGYLYDDVASYSFTVQDILDDQSGTEQTLRLVRADIAVGEKDGDLVKTLTMNFNPEWTHSVLLPCTVDLDKEINLTVQLFSSTFSFRAVPVSFRDGVLTVALYNGDQAGVALHGLVASVNEDTDYFSNDCSFGFYIPNDMFRFGENYSVGAQERWYSSDEIEGLPLRSVYNLRLPEWLLRLNAKLGDHDLLYAVIQELLIPLFLPRFVRMILKSCKDYGIDFGEELRSEWNWYRRLFSGAIKLIFTR